MGSRRGGWREQGRSQHVQVYISKLIDPHQAELCPLNCCHQRRQIGVGQYVYVFKKSLKKCSISESLWALLYVWFLFVEKKYG